MSLAGLVAVLTGALVVAVGPSPAMAAPARGLNEANIFTATGLDRTVLAGVHPKVSAHGSGSEFAAAIAEAKRTKKRVEVVGQRRPASTTYANADGTVTRVLTETPTRASTADGSLKPIDTTLATAHGRLAPKVTNAHVSLRATAVAGANPGAPAASAEPTAEPSPSASAKISGPSGTEESTPTPTAGTEVKPAAEVGRGGTAGGRVVTASVVRQATASADASTGTTPDVADLDVAGPGDISLGFGQALSAPTVDGATATYPLSATSSLTATALDNGFAANVVLDAAPDAAPTYRFPLALDGGLTPKLADGVLRFVNADGKTVALSQPLQMWDAQRDHAGDPSNVAKVTAVLVQAGGGWELDLTPSMSYLTAATTQYPVTVDPTVVTKDNADTWYYSGNTTDEGADYRLLVGTDGTHVDRSYMTWNTGPFTGRDVTSATLSLYQYEAGSCSPQTTDVYPTTTYSALDATNVKTNKDSAWAQAPSFNTGGAGCSSSNGYVGLDVTKIISGWVTGELPEYGLEMQAHVESDATYAKRFCSRNAAPSGTGHCEGTTGVPTLAITYVYAIGPKPHGGELISHRLNDRSQFSVNTQNGNGIYQASDIHLGGRGLDLSVDRVFNSGTTRPSQFGSGWAMTVGPDVQLHLGSSNDRFDFISPGGTEYGRFVRTAPLAATYYSPKFGGLDADLRDNGDNTYTITFHKTQEKYVFSALYAANGNLYLSKDIDRNGNTITYNYDASAALTSIVDTHGRSLAVHHAANGYIDSITESSAYTSSPRTWSYHYNAANQLDYYTDPTGARTDYAYTNGEVSTITDPTQADGKRPTTTIGYSNQQVTSVAYTNDSSGGVKQFTYSYSTDTTAAQSACNTDDAWTSFTSVANVNDPQGGTTKYCFKDRATAPSPTSPNGASSDAEKIRVVDGLGHHRSNTFTPDLGAQNGTSQSNDGVTGGSTVYTYDVNSNLTQATQPKDSSTSTAGTNSFDYSTSSSVAGGGFLPSSAGSGGGSCSAMSYDAKGNLSDTYQGLTAGTGGTCSGQTGGRHAHVDYNSDGTVKDAYNPSTAGSSLTTADETQYFYSTTEPNSGELTKVVRPGGNTTCTTTRTGCTTYTYDGYSRAASVTDGNGNTTRYTYDGDDRVTQVLTAGATACTTSAGTCITYAYDKEGNLTSRVDKNGTTTFTYDWQNNPATQTQPDGTKLATTFDGAGNLTKYVQTLPAASADTVTYSYDAANELTGIADATGSYAYAYNNDARPTKLTLPGTVGSIAYGYSGAGKLRTITPSNTALPAYTYGYTNGSGQDTGQLQKTTNRDGSTISYAYDGSDRLKTATASAGTNYAYTYDADSNIRTAAAGSTTTYYGYNENDQLCWSGSTDGTAMALNCPTTPSADKAYASDGAGNNLGSSTGPLHYNTQNQLDQISSPGGSSPTSQSYLDQGNNLRLTYGGTTYTQGSKLGVTAQRDSGGATYYTRDPSGRIINEHGAGGTNYYLTDRLGSTMALIDTAGTKAGSYTYDPYGKTSVASGTSTTAAQNNPWRYTGGYQNPSDGYYHFGARYYDTAGHFTQADAVAGRLNRPEQFNGYTYTAGDPINNTDLAGSFTIGGAELGGAIGGTVLGIIGDRVATALILGALATGGIGIATLVLAGAAALLSPAVGAFLGTLLGGGSVDEAEKAFTLGLLGAIAAL